MKYNPLGTTGVLVSEICLGTMTFGGDGYWKAMGELQQDAVNDIVKTAVDHGVNFIDTANVYSFGQSETLLGQSLKSLGLSRNELFIATKVRGRMGEGKNQVGLGRLQIMQQLEDSLQRLQLDHVDLYQIHGFDPMTPLEETMRGLEDVVRSGKVRYIGCSNLAAWQVMKANGIAEKNGWTKFVSTQNYYSIAGRDLENEIVPMVQDQQMGILPWSPLAGGFLSGKYTRTNKPADGSRRLNFDFPPVDQEHAYDIIEAMESIAQAHGVSVARIALAWVLAKPAVTSVIIGAKNTDQLVDNISAVDLSLTTEQLTQLDEVSQKPKPYPQWMIERQGRDRLGPSLFAAQPAVSGTK
ncbi:aldo/keto reductase [Spirosoma utsteinense]|uniref:Aryl-alcohol dehydrogenase-like putative oxidoreductase n=1 Tax=Spirosoma utsteinense TaxID=2585773 RepID=A0ABR6W5H5_9BACT|nr:aldo/keto reductase [Spirosoma utsteinense]MBC3787068.1 aryl-alcohol dehydrogenase-like putative oxidoreductase [Spirosoma utsteinense]MBC3791383.1 aryl-alcohol dehydrogenase-like putative oxidoreductase [Spirosoma utsteinense]